MPADPFTLRQADQARTDFAIVEDELEAIHKHEFQRQHSCPSTGRTTGACPGYVRDHIRALACGGPDAVSNMQWQTTADAKAKDRWERKSCGR
jgi:hypothetical protein